MHSLFFSLGMIAAISTVQLGCRCSELRPNSPESARRQEMSKQWLDDLNDLRAGMSEIEVFNFFGHKQHARNIDPSGPQPDPLVSRYKDDRFECMILELNFDPGGALTTWHIRDLRLGE